MRQTINSMRFIAATSAVAFITPFVTAVSDPWTYRNVHEHVLKEYGADNPIASLIAHHIDISTRSWDDIYRDEITTSNGAVLIIPAAGASNHSSP